MIARRKMFQPQRTASGLRCPVCRRSDRVEKASSVVGQNSGTFYVGGNPMAHRFTTSLAVALSMPPPPLPKPWFKVVANILWSLLIAALIAAASYGTGQVMDGGQALRLATMAGLICFGLVLPAYLLVRAVEEHHSSSGKLATWRLANARWNRMYYCFRDDVVFLRGAEEYEEPAMVRRLIYPQALSTTSEKPVTEPATA